MKITSLNSIASTPMQMEGAVEVTKQVPLGKADGVPTFSFRVFSVAPGGHTPYHVHAFEHLNYIIQGEGELIDAKGTRHPLFAGDFALVEPNEKHQYRNSSVTDEFKMICAVPHSYE